MTAMESQHATSPSPDPSAYAEPSLERLFALALMSELDRIGYPAKPQRANDLAADLELSKVQIYRMCRGDNTPSLHSMLRLRNLGVSFDTILSALQTDHVDQVPLTLTLPDGAVKVLPVYCDSTTSNVVLRASASGLELRVIGDATPKAANDKYVSGLAFVLQRAQIAIIEDDQATAAVLKQYLAPDFESKLFRSGKSFLSSPDLTAVDAIILDWRLPDKEGSELLSELRAITQVPIIIVTGYTSDTQDISIALHLRHTHYLAKPIDRNILRAVADAAILRYQADKPQQSQTARAQAS